jgi:hypothetical protein
MEFTVSPPNELSHALSSVVDILFILLGQFWKSIDMEARSHGNRTENYGN